LLNYQGFSLHPEFVGAWDNKGEALRMLEMYDEAIQALDEAIELDPNLADAWNNKAEALKALGKSSESNEAFAKAKELGYRR
jgi:tetratricopeptide (TPR) repeat protein